MGKIIFTKPKITIRLAHRAKFKICSTKCRGNRIKALITEIRTESKGIPIVVSRNRAEFVQRMLELEVPELTDGTVELRAIAREAGSRTKIAVFSNDPNVDPKEHV